MNWLAFAILSYLLLGLHMALRPFIEWHGASPNLVLMGVVFLCINAPREPGLLACFMLGMLQDLFTEQPMGLHALAYGLAGLYILANQRFVYREHFLTHFVMTLVGGAQVAAVSLAHAWVYARLHPSTMPAPSLRLGREALSVLYSAVVAVVVIGVLQRTKRLFGFRQLQATMNLRARTDRSHV